MQYIWENKKKRINIFFLVFKKKKLLTSSLCASIVFSLTKNTFSLLFFKSQRIIEVSLDAVYKY
jgi:hypothetical protein